MTRPAVLPADAASAPNASGRGDIEGELAAARDAAQRAEERLRTALAALADGFVLYDAEDRLVLCNERYRELYRISADLMVPGARFEDIIREGVRRGQYPDAAGGEEQWIAARLAAHRSANSVIEQRLPGGACLRIAERRTPAGDIVGFRFDISELKQAQDRLNLTLALSPAGFVCFDAAGRVAFVNPAFERMSGEPAQALLGLAQEQFDQRLRELFEPTGEAAPGDADVTSRLFFARPPKLVLKRSVRAGSGLTVHCYVDVTRDYEVDRMKSEFLSTAAHELRTPMSSVLGFTHLLLTRDYGRAKQRELVATVNEQAQRLSDMLNELLDLARIEARGGKDFRFEVQPLGTIVEETLSALHVRDDPRQVQVRLQDRHLLVNADRAKLRQALTNVVSNAYKYSPPDAPIELEVASEAGRAVLRVSDRGIGMTAEQSGRCFERFWRADPSGRIPGTGLGLSIVKEILELHGGAVEVASASGQGTCVTLRLPLVGSPPALFAPFAASSHTS